MARIPAKELEILKKEMEPKSIKKSEEYHAFKQQFGYLIPEKNDPKGFDSAKKYFELLFLEKKFNLFDVVVAERGFLLASDSDTHYRGRVLEAALNGSFDGKAKADYAWGELKCIETKPNDSTRMDQIMSCGVIFTKNRKTKEYNVTDEYEDSHFFHKMKRTLIAPYYKKGKQLGCEVNNVASLDITDTKWAERLKEDWEHIRDEMKAAIQGEMEGTVERKRSGICKSDSEGKRTPNGLLGIRSDSVTITNKFFKEIIDG